MGGPSLSPLDCKSNLLLMHTYVVQGHWTWAWKQGDIRTHPLFLFTDGCALHNCGQSPTLLTHSNNSQPHWRHSLVLWEP